MPVHTVPTDKCDARGVPDYVNKVEKHLSVIAILEPAKDNIPIRFVKVHDGTTSSSTHLEFDPKSMLLRVR